MRTLDGYFRGRTRLWAAAGLWTGILLTAFNVYAAVVEFIPQYRFRNDFRLIYGAALAAWTNGYSHLYDLAAQRATTESLGQGIYWQPYINPPPLAWLATLFLAFPFGVALLAWSVLLLLAAWIAWRLAAPGPRLTRLAHLFLFVGVFPTAFGLMVGQPVVLVAAAVAASWWLAEHRRPVLAGVALSLIALKPQLALLVPLCLLVAGRWRIFFAWLAASAVIGAVALLMLGGDGVQRYRDALSLASQWAPTRSFAVAGPLGLGLQVYALELVVVGIAAFSAWQHRGGDAGRLYATGVVSSLLFTPYVGFQDFAMLIVASWLLIRSGVTSFQVALMVVGYALLELALVVQAVPILIAEGALLLSLAWPPPRNTQVPANSDFDERSSPIVPANAGNRGG
ncbi:MAG TPA: glycosyltransferase family 87 protein [Candidatus Dormibacteraeota bacterium]|nr:glycosyltransferase family 87 protein [Candidatus Dormibacteraeota bacterium]